MQALISVHANETNSDWQGHLVNLMAVSALEPLAVSGSLESDLQNILLNIVDIKHPAYDGPII